MKNMGFSFYDWCVENQRQDLLDRWNYDLNDYSPSDVSYRAGKHAYFNCQNNSNHKPEKFRIDHITNMATSMQCKQCNSFYQWCLDNNRQELINVWDYNLNKEDIHYVPHGSGKKYYFKIEDGMPDVLYSLSDIVGSKRLSPISKFYNSFGYYLIANFGYDAIGKYWSVKNIKSPWDYDKRSAQKVWIVCQEKEYHDDYQTSPDKFVSGCRCSWCAGKKIHPLDSFAQYNINRLGEDFLDKYWCDDNIVDPWGIRPFMNDIKIKIQCQNKHYHQYNVNVADFSTGQGCPFCRGLKVHYLDSVGLLIPEISTIWSDKNVKTPYEYVPYSHETAFFKCENGTHEDYQRAIKDFTIGFRRCPKCVRAENESSYQKAVRIFLENMPYKLLHEFDCTIVPVNPHTKMKMPFDNEVCDINGKNLIIETHGPQHYELNGWHVERAKHTNNTPEAELEYQKWKDNFKKDCAIVNGYEYLEIPYYKIKDDSYKKLIVDKIKSMKT